MPTLARLSCSTGPDDFHQIWATVDTAWRMLIAVLLCLQPGKELRSPVRPARHARATGAVYAMNL
jgi:hypothetical protein